MGQTVSLPSCISGGSVVRVMDTAGVFESYEFPVVTAEVMLKHPDHLVVHCAPTTGNRTAERKINIMLPEQPLLPGEPYMLYPIPERHKAALASSKSFSVLKRQMSTDGEVSAAPEKKKGRRHALKLVATRLQLVTLVASKLGSKAEREQREPFLQSKEEPQKKKAPQPLEMPMYQWKPDLASIPESPLGFHSTPQTPRGLYKMDAISEGRPYSVPYPGQTTPVHQPALLTVPQ